MSTTETTLTGRVVRPGDSDYAAASAGWNLLFSHRPAAVVFAQETAGCRQRTGVGAAERRSRSGAQRRARPGGLERRRRRGRHRRQRNEVGDDRRGTRRRPPSAPDSTRWRPSTALGAAGFAAPTGTEGTVGLVGATLGGGFGLLTRNYGMASRQPARGRGRRRRPPTAAPRQSSPTNRTIPICCGRCAVRATATSASSPR